MTAIARKLAQRLWKLALPARQTVAAHLDHYLDQHVQLWLDRTEPLRVEQQRASEDVTLVVDALTRELVRLQAQIQALEQTIAERHSATPTIGEHRQAA